MSTAYLLICLRHAKPMPIVLGFDVFSEESPTMRSDHFAVVLLQETAPTFGEARDRVIKLCQQVHPRIYPLLEKR